MRLARHLARVERGEMRLEISWRNLNEREHLEEVGENARIILKFIFKM